MNKVPYYALMKNMEKVKLYFGSEFLEKSYFDKLTVEDSLNANNQLMDIVYGKNVSELIKKREYEEVKKQYLAMYKSIIQPKELLDGLDMDKIGIVLIRPETLGLSEQYKHLLQLKGLEIVLEKNLIISFEQYWILYQHGLIHYDCRYDFPTRTFNYAGNECKLLVVTPTKELNLSENTSDYLKKIKGKHGRYTEGTLRGDIAFNGLKDYVTQNNTFTPEANIILDPIGMYRVITREMVDYDRAHEIADLPLLFYAGQAIHTPDDDEIERDFRTLCSSQDIEKVKTKILERKR